MTLTFAQRKSIYSLLRNLPTLDKTFTWDNGDKLKLADLKLRENGMSVYLDTRSARALPQQHASVLIDAMIKLTEQDWNSPDSDQTIGEREIVKRSDEIHNANANAVGWLKNVDPSAPSKAVRPPSVPEGWVKGKATIGERPAKLAELGLYVVDGIVYKVKMTKSDRKVAVEIGTMTRGHAKARYAKGMVYKLTDDQRMSAAQAKAYGDKFGICVNCGRGLSDPASVRLGMGPICHKRLTSV